MSEYHLSVNGEHHFDVERNDADQLDAVATAGGTFHVIEGAESFSGEIVTADFLAKKYTVRINNNTYHIDIQNPLDRLIVEMGFEVGAGKEVNAINAPMPGLILEINVEIGQTVAKNDLLLILGAMKMENSFLSPRDGKIKSISVAKGDAVDKGQLLIEFE